MHARHLKLHCAAVTEAMASRITAAKVSSDKLVTEWLAGHRAGVEAAFAIMGRGVFMHGEGGSSPYDNPDFNNPDGGEQ